MIADATLNLLDPKIANLLRTTQNDSALRCFARESARFAVDRLAFSNPPIEQALQILENPVKELGEAALVQLRNEITRIIEDLDERAFDLRDKVEAGEASHDDYLDTFSKARAASSVLASLSDSAIQAAAEACYEAFASMDDRKELEEIASKLLG